MIESKKNLILSSVNQSLNIFIQFLVPVFLIYGGTPDLLPFYFAMSAIGSVFLFSDFGYAQALATKYHRCVISEDVKGASQIASAIVKGSLAYVAVTVLLLISINAVLVERLSTVERAFLVHAAVTAVVLNVLLAASAAAREREQYSQFLKVTIGFRVISTLGLILVPFVGNDSGLILLFYTVFLAVVGFLSGVLLAGLDWCRNALRHRSDFSSVHLPSFGNLNIQINDYLYAHLPKVILASAGASGLVAVFSTHLIFSRQILFFSRIIRQAFIGKLTALLNQPREFRAFVRKLVIGLIAASVATALIQLLLCQWFFGLWTASSVKADYALIFILILATLLIALSAVLWLAQQVQENHVKSVCTANLFSLIVFGVAFVAGFSFSLEGIALLILLQAFFQFVVALNRSGKLWRVSEIKPPLQNAI